MRPEIVALLACPLCREDLRQDGSRLCCRLGHSFDIARQGYVNLLPGRAGASTGDSAAMVAARESFLAAGHFAGLRAILVETVAEHITSAADPVLVEVGAGTGYYLAALLERLPKARGLALDLSTYASRRAAKSHDRVGAVVCDVWRELPVKDASPTVLLDVFAPRNAGEFHRVLSRDGLLVIVTPTPAHLREIVAALELLTVDPRKQERIDESLRDLFVPCAHRRVDETLELSHAQATTLVRMGPSSRHVSDEGIALRLSTLPQVVRTTLSVTLTVYRRL